MLVYTYNEVTKNISGQFIEKWSEKENWCLSNLTLGAKLPVDIVEVCDRIKSSSGDKERKIKDTFLDISGARYFKSRKDGSTDFATRLVSNGGIYSWYTKEVKKRIYNCWRKLVTEWPTNTVRLTLHACRETRTVKWTCSCVEEIFWC